MNERTCERCKHFARFANPVMMGEKIMGQCECPTPMAYDEHDSYICTSADASLIAAKCPYFTDKAGPQPGDMVLVEWIDTHSRDGWDAVQDHIRWWADHGKLIHSVGILLDRTEGAIIIARDRTVVDADWMASGVLFIPDSAVRCVTLLLPR